MKELEEAYERSPGKCLFCGKEFEDDEKEYPEGLTAETKEGIHRARNHVDADEKMADTPEKQKKGNLIEEWGTEA